MIKAPTTAIATIMPATEGRKYISDIDGGVGVGCSVGVGAGASTEVMKVDAVELP